MGGFIAVGVGAMLGAWARWGLALWLDPLVAALPLGTLAANLTGGYLIGIAVGAFQLNVAVPPEIKLFVLTGFLGALTTFSTFSSEVVAMLQRGDYGWAATTSALHLFGSLVMTTFGILTCQRLTG